METLWKSMEVDGNWRKPVKVNIESWKASIASMEASTTSMEAPTTSMEAFIYFHEKSKNNEVGRKVHGFSGSKWKYMKYIMYWRY